MTARGVTGARIVDSPMVARKILAMVQNAKDGTVFVTGGCKGVDAMVARFAFAEGRGITVHTIMPADRRHVDPLWRDHCHTFEEMPPGTSYKDRDARMVQAVEERGGFRFDAFPMYPERDTRSLRSGTWMTVRLALAAHMAVVIVIQSEVSP